MVLEKYHGLGNDYLVLDPRRNEGAPKLTPGRARLICDRNFGAGADGILVGPLFDGASQGGSQGDSEGASQGASQGGEMRVRIFNPDGSEAEKSGSGVRIFARYLRDFGYVPGEPFTLRTLGGDVGVTYLDGNGGGGDAMVRVDMGRATFWSDEIPVAGARREVVDELLDFGGFSCRATCVSVGNPHCVIMAGTDAELTKERAVELGEVVWRARHFPNRINMQLARVRSASELQIEIFERGAGYTLSSGTSSCAAACAARRLGLVGAEVDVRMPGGVLRIEIGDDWQVRMTGAVSRVCTITFARAFVEKLEKKEA